ncbi:inositol monophosphatase family protein [Hydrogenimonas sp. SS33]|uniref:inositol monophosphatase family protein n=1 Tax=Hydrogenimonas leucolamina TaxID=2954236 RepID=UPI00336C040A
MTPFLQAIRTAAREIAAELEKGWRYAYAVKGEVGAGGDRSAGIDRLAEKIYIRHLAPFGAIDSEECGLIGEGEATVVLDPIDGSDNAISGLPYFGSSVALTRNGRTEEGVVVNLANGDCFYKGEEGLLKGSLLHDRFEPVRKRELSTVGIFEKAYAHPDLALALLRRKMKFRSPGAVALSLAYAHNVDFVIFAGPRRTYDFAAALWMCEDLEVVKEEALLIVAKEEETARRLLRMAHAEEG